LSVLTEGNWTFNLDNPPINNRLLGLFLDVFWLDEILK